MTKSKEEFIKGLKLNLEQVDEFAMSLVEILDQIEEGDLASLPEIIVSVEKAIARTKADTGLPSFFVIDKDKVKPLALPKE